MNAEEINSKLQVTEAAVQLYQNDRYTMSNLVDETGLTASEIYSLFPNKRAILEFFYEGIVIRYRAMISEIDDFGSYTVSEKLSNFVFTSFDMMEEHRAFVESTYDAMVFRRDRSNFRSAVQELFRDFITEDADVAVSASFFMGDFFYSFLAKEYTHILKFWLKDKSAGSERSMALTDKLTGFVEEVLYNKIADKGFDLAKYLYNHAGLGRDIPVVSDLFSCWFSKEKEEEVEIEINDEEEE